jgi:hypothetical protein
MFGRKAREMKQQMGNQQVLKMCVGSKFSEVVSDKIVLFVLKCWVGVGVHKEIMYLLYLKYVKQCDCQMSLVL